MKDSYKFFVNLFGPLVRLVFPCRVIGAEKIPRGKALLCVNHSHMMDPVIVVANLGKKHRLFTMAKAELFRIPVLRSLLKAVGVFPVNRGETDIRAIRTAMKYLKSGEKVLLFPEGTRVAEDQTVEGKTGAVRIAIKTGASIVPMFLTRRGKLFRRSKLVVGEPFALTPPADKNYEPMTEELMDRIYSLEKSE